MDKKYRSYRDLFFNSLNGNELNVSAEQMQMDDILTKRTINVMQAVKAIQGEVENSSKERSICTSLIHMFVNRLFRGNHRKQEMLLYYFLYKHFESIKAMQLKKKERGA